MVTEEMTMQEFSDKYHDLFGRYSSFIYRAYHRICAKDPKIGQTFVQFLEPIAKEKPPLLFSSLLRILRALGSIESIETDQLRLDLERIMEAERQNIQQILSA